MALLLKYDEFKMHVASTLEDTQIIEEDLRWIYALLHKGKTDKNYKKATKKNVLKLVNDVEALDFSHQDHKLNLEDYAVLRQIKPLREYIANKIFAKFVNNQDFLRSLEYSTNCEKIFNYRHEIEAIIPRVKQFRKDVEEKIGAIDAKVNSLK